MARLLSALVALVLLAGLPAAATAQTARTNAPPGNSAIDEYLETVPGATGDQRPGTPGAGGGKSGGVLTAAERARLEKLGPDGKALADAVDATAPPATKPGEKIGSGSVEGRSPISAVLEAVTGSDGGGMGFLLPVILLASLLGIVALAVLRRRSVS